MGIHNLTVNNTLLLKRTIHYTLDEMKLNVMTKAKTNDDVVRFGEY